MERTRNQLREDLSILFLLRFEISCSAMTRRKLKNIICNARERITSDVIALKRLKVLNGGYLLLVTIEIYCKMENIYFLRRSAGKMSVVLPPPLPRCRSLRLYEVLEYFSDGSRLSRNTYIVSVYYNIGKLAQAACVEPNKIKKKKKKNVKFSFIRIYNRILNLSTIKIICIKKKIKNK